MVFSDFYKRSKSPLSKMRLTRSHETAPMPTEAVGWTEDDFADLMSKDKVKSKDAVRRYLAATVRNDWEFIWPPQSLAAVVQSGFVQEPAAGQTRAAVKVTAPPDGTGEDTGYQVDDGSEIEEHGQDDDALSVYSVISDDPGRWKPRLEWASEISDDELVAVPNGCFTDHATDSRARSSIQAKRDKRRRQVREEMTWNEGLACFEARRNAWTGAKVARVRSRAAPSHPSSPSSAKRLLFRRSTSDPPSSPVGRPQSLSGEVSGLVSEASSLIKQTGKEMHPGLSRDSCLSRPRSSDPSYPVDTLLPIPQPILPSNSTFRASISPTIYLVLYDKICLQSLQPSCPINLSDMIRSCVAGWKRDGEWPLRSSEHTFAPRPRRPSAASSGGGGGARGIRRMSFGMFSREKIEEAPQSPEPQSRAGKGFRRSLQRAFGLGSTATSGGINSLRV